MLIGFVRDVLRDHDYVDLSAKCEILNIIMLYSEADWLDLISVQVCVCVRTERRNIGGTGRRQQLGVAGEHRRSRAMGSCCSTCTRIIRCVANEMAMDLCNMICVGRKRE